MFSVWLQDSVSQCREKCNQELEDLRNNQTEKVKVLLQEQEEKQQKLVLENQKKVQELLDSLQELKRENEEKEKALKAENERALALLIQDNEAQEALMVAKHDEEERAARRATELEVERNASATSRPHIPECPVGNISEFEILRTLPDGQSGLLFDFLALGTFHNHV